MSDNFFGFALGAAILLSLIKPKYLKVIKATSFLMLVIIVASIVI